MVVLLTGVAGFIGMHVAAALAKQGHKVIGIDSLNEYYSVKLKNDRIKKLKENPGFAFIQADVADPNTLDSIWQKNSDITHIVHLAAQAGVRYSLESPRSYIRANIDSHLNILELARHMDGQLKHLVYASSSSVYGANEKQPFSISNRVDKPVSLYAATKRADELMSYTYSHLFKTPATGLRFFTVYGPWGRPDMAAYIFTRKILAGEPLQVFNHGESRRDFTFIDDIVAGVIAALDRPPTPDQDGVPHRLYNLGNNRTERLRDFIAAIEAATGQEAELELLPLQPGDVEATYADIEASRQDLGYEPVTTINEGIPRFVEWYRDYHNV